MWRLYRWWTTRRQARWGWAHGYVTERVIGELRSRSYRWE